MRRSFEISIRQLVAVAISLLALAGLSWGLSYAHLSPWAGVGVALGIAAAKVALVMLFFMELGEQRGGLRIVAICGPAFVVMLLLLVLGDVWTR